MVENPRREKQISYSVSQFCPPILLKFLFLYYFLRECMFDKVFPLLQKPLIKTHVEIARHNVDGFYFNWDKSGYFSWKQSCFVVDTLTQLLNALACPRSTNCSIPRLIHISLTSIWYLQVLKHKIFEIHLQITSGMNVKRLRPDTLTHLLNPLH